MNVLFRTYHNFLMKFPIGVQAVQTGLLMGSGDLIAQTFVEKKPLNKIDVVRTSKFTLIGAVFVGPSLTMWYRFLEKYFGKVDKWAAIKKVVVDQAIFAPFFLSVIMGVIGVTQGKTVNEISGQIKRDYPDILKNNYKIWPAVQLCNFYLVPLNYQVITVQVVAVFWNTYFSWKVNNNIRDQRSVTKVKMIKLRPMGRDLSSTTSQTLKLFTEDWRLKYCLKDSVWTFSLMKVVRL